MTDPGHVCYVAAIVLMLLALVVSVLRESGGYDT